MIPLKKSWSISWRKIRWGARERTIIAIMKQYLEESYKVKLEVKEL